MSHEDFAAIYTSPDRLLGTTKLIREVLPTEAQAMSKEWKFTGFWVMESAQQVQEPGAFGGPEVLQRSGGQSCVSLRGQRLWLSAAQPPEWVVERRALRGKLAFLE